MSPTVYLVSGANRGLGELVAERAAIDLLTQISAGFATVKALAAKPDVVVYAGARQPSAAVELQALSKDHPGKVFVLKLSSADEIDNRAAIEEIQKTSGRLDVVIANAGSLYPMELIPGSR
jgi:NAD(P)-dependent dehydrogenase (short-subunit alcohol dehydrogenase family)